MTGILDKAKGAVKEAVGGATGDQNLEADGKLDQAKGHVKQAVENVKENVKEAVDGLKNRGAEAAREHAAQTERDTTPKH